ncbi:MAG: GNAT family N-acetyltransferase [Chloroflexota bacterium]
MSTNGVIQAGKVVLRNKRLEDAADDYEWRVDGELAALDAAPPLTQPYQQFLRSYQETFDFPSPWSQRFAIDTLDGKHIGNCMCYDINLAYGEAEVGIMIGNRAYWDNGYGSHSMVGLIDHMFTSTSLRRLYLHTLEWNLRAQRSFAKCGFTQVRSVKRYGQGFLRMEISRDHWMEIREEKLAELRRGAAGQSPASSS